tara:strand:- start:346 stop:567 length:222 start_codon:yes stop_codon:yes gene_type:complete
MKKFNIKEWKDTHLKESVNDQAVKEFGDLLKLLLNQSNGLAIEKAIGDLQPVPAKSLRNQISFLHKQLAKLTK